MKQTIPSEAKIPNPVPPTETMAHLGEVLDEAIRHQHPEWIESDGNCPRCASYVHELAGEMEGRGHLIDSKKEAHFDRLRPSCSTNHACRTGPMPSGMNKDARMDTTSTIGSKPKRIF